MVAIAKAEAVDNLRPKERCGAVVKDGEGVRLVECKNIHSDPYQYFKIGAEEWAFLDVDFEILAVWHTHPNASAAPSQSDRVMMEATGLPWHIVSWPEGGHSYIEPTGYEAPYLGRVFVHGIMDCYSLCRDWYKRELGIDLPNDEREDGWWDNGKNIYLDGFEKNGFVSIPTDVRNLKRGDGLLIQYVSKVPNHAAIYLGDGKILHHVDRRLSEIAPYGGYWMKHTTHYLRHQTQL